MSKLFYTRKEGEQVIGYVHEKKFRLINISTLLLIGSIVPAVYSLGTGNIIGMVLFALLIVFYIILWIGKDRVILKKRHDGWVEIFDKDLKTGDACFSLKDMEDLQILSKIKEVSVGNLGARSNTVNAAQLHITFNDGNKISFGSNTYGGQLKQIKKYLTEEYRALQR